MQSHKAIFTFPFEVRKLCLNIIYFHWKWRLQPWWLLLGVHRECLSQQSATFSIELPEIAETFPNFVWPKNTSENPKYCFCLPLQDFFPTCATQLDCDSTYRFVFEENSISLMTRGDRSTLLPPNDVLKVYFQLTYNICGGSSTCIVYNLGPSYQISQERMLIIVVAHWLVFFWGIIRTQKCLNKLLLSSITHDLVLGVINSSLHENTVWNYTLLHRANSPLALALVP